MTPGTITGTLAETLSGVVILLEHRFFGQSNPYPNLSEESFSVHTLQQAIDDHEYFANNVVLDMPGGDQVGPNNAPWILVGGSYAGALTSYTMYEYVSLRRCLRSPPLPGQALTNFQKTRRVLRWLCVLRRGRGHFVRPLSVLTVENT